MRFSADTLITARIHAEELARRANVAFYRKEGSDDDPQSASSYHTDALVAEFHALADGLGYDLVKRP